MPLQTPVAFFLFRRPDVTARVFAAIAAARPRTLLLVSDGPRADRAGEAELVVRTRALVERIDWNCTVRTNFATENLGCKRRFATGLAWIFEQTEEAIVLEDDCLPDATFFHFCEELLERYRDDRRVAAISGSNFQGGRSRTTDSYYFSNYFHCWGWASWRRTWQHVDLELKDWPQFQRRGLLGEIADSPLEADYWNAIFQRQHSGQIDSWAYPWLYSCWTQGALTILPNVNLVNNIGFGEQGAHTNSKATGIFANLSTSSIPIISHPPFVVRHRTADAFTFNHVFQGQPVGLTGAIRKAMRRVQRPVERKLKALRAFFSP